MSYNSLNYLAGLPRVAVSLKNCALVNTLQAVGNTTSNNNVYFSHMSNGIDVTVDNCTSDKGMEVSSCVGEKVSVQIQHCGAIVSIVMKVVLQHLPVIQ